MAKFIVAGLINVETTCKIESFPLSYAPVRYPFFGLKTTVSGVGYNVAKALTTLGNEVDLLSIIGNDSLSHVVRHAVQDHAIADKRVLSLMDETAQSVILYDETGKRAIHVDLKNIQETLYPLVHLDFTGVDLAVLCNINFTRPMLEQAKQAGVPIATDVHTLRSLEDDYNRDYMTAADILFMSDEGLPMSPQEWVWRVWERYPAPILVIGMGAKGALLAIRAEQRISHFPARALRPIVNTIGAGDALFSAFVHSYAETKDPYLAIQKAILFAGYKIGEKGAADGFLSAAQLETFYQKQ